MRKFTKEFIEEMGKILLEESADHAKDIGTGTVDDNGLAWVSGPADIFVTVREPTAVISIGSLYDIKIYDKTFTEEQIKNMREFFGWEVKNLCE